MRLIIIFLLLLTFLNAKKDFYYSFIDSSGSQISEKRKQTISDGFDVLQAIRNLARDGKIDEAYTQIKSFKEKNTVKVLTSDTMLLYADLSLKKISKRFIIDAAKELENAINSSQINEYDLPKAYMLLVDLKLEINKIDDAKYFAQIIMNNFDTEITKTQGKIALAKVYRYQKDYLKAIKILYEILTITDDKYIATVVADELFDIYILDDKIDKANELISQVLKNNIEYYANDSYLANKKINKLIKANMPEFASEILRELLNKSTKDESIEDFKFKLANTYMLMYDRTNYYLEKAKELYKDIINDYAQGEYAKKSKVFIDEILMRQGRISPSVVATKYISSEAMQQKALLQELLNDKVDRKYEFILKSEKIYRKISNEITKRFGYETIDNIFDEVNIEMINELLSEGKCFEINKILKTLREETFEKLIKDETSKYKFFECLIEVPYKRVYSQIKDTFNNSRDGNIYLYLERMAYSLGLINEALEYSAKVEMVNDENILLKEFLYRYQILKSKEDGISLDKFFAYTKENENYITENENNPVIIDFYNDYYLYLFKNGEIEKSIEILNKLNEKQKDLKAYIYSPFVETELSKLAKDKNKIQESLDLLLQAINNTRRIKPNDEVKIYYDILKTYETLGNQDKKNEYILKCKEVKNAKDSLYKKMCDEM